MILQFNTLYARDSKGKILQWKIEVNGGSQVDISMSYGELNGAQVLNWQRNIQGKNIGKSNETNAYEQAVLNAQSKVKLQKKRGYMSLEDLDLHQSPILTTAHLEDVLKIHLPINRTDAAGDVKPMKAQQYYRSKKDWTAPDGTVWEDRKYYYLRNPNVKKESNAIITKFPCMGQPKINGVRVTARYTEKVLLKSKEGKEYTVAHINDFFNMNPDIFEYEGIDLVLDGELYIHRELLQDIGSAINKPNLNTPRVVFILFDIAIEDKTNVERWNIIKEHILPKLESHLNCPIQVIKTVKIASDTTAQLATDMFITQGYEGSIFRQFKGHYAFGKRPQDMTKLKRTISSEFKIIDVVSQEVDGSKGNFVCITKEGQRFSVNPKGDDAFKKEVLRNRSSYIGKNLTCSFYEWTKDMKPFHILDNTVRDYE